MHLLQRVTSPALVSVLEQKTQNTTAYFGQPAQAIVGWMSLDAHQNFNSYFLV